MNKLICSRCRGPRGIKHRYCRNCQKEYEKNYKRPKYADWSEENKRKARCRAYTSSYLRLGKIERGPCEVDGCKNKPEMHHDDYTKPLMVRWICRFHHLRLHEHLRGPRICARCKIVPPHVSKDGIYRSYCKKCLSIVSAERQKAKRRILNPEKYNPDGTRKLKYSHSTI
jgi:hypothetical protein